MPTYDARITVRLKSGVLDPQGKAIEGALASLDFPGVEKVRQGKIFDISLNAASKQAATDQLAAMADKLLANTVVEDFEVKLV